MCGLFGFATSKHFTQQRVLFYMLSTAMENRGTCSYGVSFGNLRNDLDTVRGLGGITGDDELVGLVSDSRLLLGHTRLATHGEVTVANAHPFLTEGHLVAHNGVIYNAETLAKQDGNVYDVDSQALAWRVAMGQDVSDCSGYGSVTWFDPNGRLFVSRMSGGALRTFTVTDPSNNSKAHVFVSSLTARVSNKMDLSKGLGYFGLTLENEKEPKEARVLQVTPGGFRIKERKLVLGDNQDTYFDLASYYGERGLPSRYQRPVYSKYRGRASDDVALINDKPSHPIHFELFPLSGISEDTIISSVRAWNMAGCFLDTDGSLCMWRLNKVDDTALFTYIYDDDATERYLTLGGDVTCSIYRSSKSGQFLLFNDDRVHDLWIEGLGDPEVCGAFIMSGKKTAEEGNKDIIVVDRHAFNEIAS